MFTKDNLKKFIQNVDKEHIKINDYIIKDTNLENLFYHKTTHNVFDFYKLSKAEHIKIAIINFHNHILSNINNYPQEIHDFLKFYKII